MAYKKNYKKDYKQEMEDITNRLETGIKELFESEKYKNYLNTMAKFHHYSVNNTLLIHMQMPDSKMVASYKAWKEKFNRYVKQGEKAIRIFAPIEVKTNMNIEADKIDPVTKLPVLDENGDPVTEIKNLKELRFKLVPVFDVSQTEGEPLPTISESLDGNIENYEAFIETLKSVSPFPISFAKLDENTDGRCIFGNENRIEIREGMSEVQTVSAAIHEITHSILHKKENAKLENADNKSLKTKEVEAESVSYVVCQHYGIETSANSFGYVASWSSGKELTELKNSLETIRSTAAEIINGIDEHFAQIKKEREAENKLEAETKVTLDPASEPTVTIIWSENGHFQDGETMSLLQANNIIKTLDEENFERPGYDKTTFRIDFMINGEYHNYEGRQDLGDGDGSLIDHIEKFCLYHKDNEEWNNYILHNDGKEALEAEKAKWDMLLNEFVPYLKLHCNLSEMEQAAKTALQNGENMTSAEINYHNAIIEYVSKCREKINYDDYNLEPAPKLADFDTELKAYKEHVKEEISQEAASAGMTVEEYAANGYEPKLENPDVETMSLTQSKDSEDFLSEPTFREIADNEEYTETAIKIENQSYIIPDKNISIEERNEFGYDYENMLPLTQSRALELFDSDNVVYMLYPDNTESMVFEREEILNCNDLIFGIEKEDWETSKEYEQLKTQAENEILSENKGKFSIYQLKDGDKLHYHRFASFNELKKKDLKIEANNYELIYTDNLQENDTLDTIYSKFNIDRPDDFKGHSLSISDIIVMEKDGEISSHYVDKTGFKELPVFLGNETFPSEKEIKMAVAAVSNYKGMTAFLDKNNYVYLGKSENCHREEISYYDNSDKSVLFVSDNEKILYFLCGKGWSVSQQDMIDKGYHTKETYEEFDRVQKTVLNDLPYKDGFDGIKFNGEPFKLFVKEEAKLTAETDKTLSANNNNDLIGKSITIGERQFRIESVSEISGTVSMLDLTFQEKAGFPISREEPIEYVRKFLKQEPEKNNTETLDKNVNINNTINISGKEFRNENKKTKRSSVLKMLKENKKEVSDKIKENKETIKKQDRRTL